MLLPLPLNPSPPAKKLEYGFQCIWGAGSPCQSVPSHQCPPVRLQHAHPPALWPRCSSSQPHQSNPPLPLSALLSPCIPPPSPSQSVCVCPPSTCCPSVHVSVPTPAHPYSSRLCLSSVSLPIPLCPSPASTCLSPCPRSVSVPRPPTPVHASVSPTWRGGEGGGVSQSIMASSISRKSLCMGTFPPSLMP